MMLPIEQLSGSIPTSVPSYHDELALATHLAQELERRLAGRDQPLLVRRAPGDVCHLGVLAPRSAQTDGGTGAPDEANTTPNPDVSTQPSPPPMPPSPARPPSSLGVRLLVTPPIDGPIVLHVRPRFAIYTRHFATWAEQRRELGTGDGSDTDASDTAQIRLIDVCVRHAIDAGIIPITIDTTQLPIRHTDKGQIQRTLDTILHTVVQQTERHLWRPPGKHGRIAIADLATPATYTAVLDQLTDPPPSLALRAVLDVRARRTPQGVLIQIYLCNSTLADPLMDAFNILADVQLQVVIRAGTLIPIELVPVPDDYQYDRTVWAVGHACSARVSSNRRVIQTCALAIYHQPRLGTRDDPPARLADLANDPVPVLATIYDAMHAYAQRWRADLDTWAANAPKEDAVAWSSEHMARQHDLAGFYAEIDRFASGIAALQADSRLSMAFQAMHRVFIRVAAGRYDTWRLFQIVFIVSQLPALIIREGITTGVWPTDTPRQWADTLDRVDVLWFPTGGGKTEGYFGLIGCAILYDRLRGKDGGVTAWLRFPLRMLSVQQLQRAVTLVYETERERQMLEQLLDQPLGDPIALGYLVGKDMTPNRLHPDDASWPLHQISADATLMEKLHLVRHCPACPKQRGTVVVQVDPSCSRIRLVCIACKLELPVYASDSEVLRFLPSLVIGTVDKLASVAYRAALTMLWRGPTWRCPHPEHGYGVGRWCMVESCPTNPRTADPPKPRLKVRLIDPSPALHIQDELHLLQQELGAFAGHYATMLRAEERAATGRPGKILAATATIEGFDHQARHIYGAPAAVRFPGRDRSRTQTFYTQLLRDETGKTKTARFYLAFQPPHLTPADAATLCAAILHDTIARLYANPYGARILLRLRDAYTAEDIRALLWRYDTTATYVGTRHAGTRIAEALERTPAGKGRPAGSDDLAVRLLTADTPFGEIARAVDELEAAPPWEDTQHLDALVATSVISHGVDIARLNLLVMEHVPDIAEYIQASSRSGRRHVGLVVAVLPRFSLRALSIYHRFTEFHRHLDRMIPPVPINRFAKAAMARTFPGVLLGALFSRALPQVGAGVDLDTVYGPVVHTSLPDVIALAEDTYGLQQGIYPMALETQARTQIAEQAALFCAALARLKSSRQKYLRDAFQPRPMTSLRDVDLAVPFAVADEVDDRVLRWFRRRADTQPGTEEESP